MAGIVCEVPASWLLLLLLLFLCLLAGAGHCFASSSLLLLLLQHNHYQHHHRGSFLRSCQPACAHSLLLLLFLPATCLVRFATAVV